MKRVMLAIGLSFAGCGEPMQATTPAEGPTFEDEVLVADGYVEQRHQLVGTQVVFVDFNGPTITDCDGFCSDAPTNRSWAIGAHFGRNSYDFAPWGTASKRAAVVQRLNDAFAPYDVEFVTQRPASSPYTMLVVSASTSGPAHGVAPLDCDNDNPNDIAFVYRVGSSSVAWVSQAAAHELGHSFGLSHVTSNADFMHWASAGDDFTVANWDTARSVKKCFDGGVQDAPAMLTDTLGPAGAEPVDPVFEPTTGDQVALHDARTGIWYLQAADGSTRTFYYGDPADTPFAGDWDCDGVDSLGLYRESAGYLFLRNSNSQGVADVEIYYGNPGDLPLAGDWDGDGCDTIGIYRPSEQKFYLRNTNTAGFADIEYTFGNPGDVPLAGDWDGDGTSTIGLWRPASGRAYLLDDHQPVGAREVALPGDPDDRVVVGDWDGDGADDIGFFDPGTATFRLVHDFGSPSVSTTFQSGESHMSPIGGDWGL